MKRAGIREARQNLSSLIDEVKKGREVILQERGTPVARLVPYVNRSAKPLLSHRRFRRALGAGLPDSSPMVSDDREDRF